jgi:hypothetical protein
MAASLLGYWPGEVWREPTMVTSLFGSEERLASSRRSIIPKPSRVFDGAAERPLSSVSEGNPSDEVYYDALAAPVVVPQKQAVAPSSSNVTGFESALTDRNDTDDIEWRKFQPPKELFDVPYGTPLEIESIIIASVERLQQQLAEEQSFYENAAFIRAQEQGRAEQQLSVVEVPSQTGNGELLTVSNAGRVLKLAPVVEVPNQTGNGELLTVSNAGGVLKLAPVVEVPSQTGNGELLTVSNAGEVLKLAHF